MGLGNNVFIVPCSQVLRKKYPQFGQLQNSTFMQQVSDNLNFFIAFYYAFKVNKLIEA